MVNRVIEADLDVDDCRELQDSAKVDARAQLVAAEALQLFEVGRPSLLVPVIDCVGGGDRRRSRRRREVECARDDAAQEAVFRRHDVPGEIDGALTDRIGPVVGFVCRE